MNISRYSGILGILIFLLAAYLLSNNRKKIPYKTVIYGLITQFLIAFFMLKTPVGVEIFKAVNHFFVKVLSYSDQGSKFLFGSLVDSQEIGAMLIAFISIIYLLNDVVGISGITLEKLLGYLLSPIAVLIGIPPSESVEVGKLLGIKTIFTEFLSYLQLKTHIVNQTLSPRTIAITTYALCGFTHFGSIAILIGGIGTLVPSKKPVVSRFALKSLVAGFLATMMTAAIAGLIM